MRVRALLMVVLIAGWSMPATGHSCSSDELGAEAHEHAGTHEAPAHSHVHDGHSDAGADDGEGGHHAAATRDHVELPRESASDDSCCCLMASDTSDAEAPLVAAKPRPKFSAVVLPLSIASELPVVTSVTGAQLRQQQPPPLPYFHTRRPLLI
jgi:hypothetical protein